MRSIVKNEPEMFATPPIGILRDTFCAGERRLLFRMDNVYRPIARTILKSVTEILNPEFVYSGYHYHEGVEIFRVLEGSAKIVINNRPISIERDDVIIVNPFEAHGTYLVDTDSAFTRTCVMFHPYHVFPAESGNDRFFADLKGIFFENRIPASHPAGKALRDSLDGMVELFESRPLGWTVKAFAELMNFYSIVVSSHLYREQSGNTSYMFDFMTRVSTYIDDHLDEDISTTDIAAFCQYSTEHFCRLFKKTVGISAIEYINEYRIGKSELLLSQTDLSITEIAAEVGFENANYFARVFNKIRKESPSEYRKRIAE